MCRQEVAQRLFVSPNTVRTHVQKLLKSANVHTTLALIAAAREARVEPLEPVGRVPAQRSARQLTPSD
jgi:DNA-binding NarL/FixJ family response regulator